MLIGYFQFEPVFGEVSKNLDSVEEAVDGKDFDLLVLPELCTTGYQFTSRREIEELAESVPDGAAVKRIVNIAQRSNAHIVAGVAEKSEGKIYNSAILAGPSGHIYTYRKIHLFFEEKLWFTPGSQLPKVIDIGSIRIGIIICFDWFFPEIVRILCLAGADAIVQPANLILPYCQSAMKTRSIENRVFTVTSNRIGTEMRGGKKPLTFTGCSQVTDPLGETLIAAPETEQELKVVEIDPEQARDKKVNPYNSLFEDRRPDLYAQAIENENLQGD